jgi:CheY-like chemotaxis protein
MTADCMINGNERRRKCIVADDDAAFRTLLYAILGGCHLDLRGFGSAREVVEACRRDAPDFLFLDVALQGSDAIDVIRALASQVARASA